MKRFLKFDWKTKFVDLLIVIIGVTVAFQLNIWNDSNKQKKEMNSYLSGFAEECKKNEQALLEEINHIQTEMALMDSLLSLLKSSNYENVGVRSISPRMMQIPNFTPAISTMKNITATGDFSLIKNSELRKQIIITYESFEQLENRESIMSDYVQGFIVPFFINNTRLNDFSANSLELSKDYRLENIAIGYSVLLRQNLESYKDCYEKSKMLNEFLKPLR